LLPATDAATPAVAGSLFGGATDFVGRHHLATGSHFRHADSRDYVGRDPAKMQLHWNPQDGFLGTDAKVSSFHAHPFPTRGAADAHPSILLQSLSQTAGTFHLDPKMKEEAKRYRELMKCMHLAKEFKGTKPAQRKVTQKTREDAMRCLKLVGKRPKAGSGPGAARTRAATRANVQHSVDYLFREVPGTKLRQAARRGGKASHKTHHQVPAWVAQQAWDDKAQDALEAKKMSPGQVQHDAAKWDASFPDVHVRPPSKGRSSRESTGSTTHYFGK
jgi:hypothetical protein